MNQLLEIFDEISAKNDFEEFLETARKHLSKLSEADRWGLWVKLEGFRDPYHLLAPNESSDIEEFKEIVDNAGEQRERQSFFRDADAGLFNRCVRLTAAGAEQAWFVTQAVSESDELDDGALLLVAHIAGCFTAHLRSLEYRVLCEWYSMAGRIGDFHGNMNELVSGLHLAVEGTKVSLPDKVDRAQIRIKRAESASLKLLEFLRTRWLRGYSEDICWVRDLLGEAPDLVKTFSYKHRVSVESEAEIKNTKIFLQGNEGELKICWLHLIASVIEAAGYSEKREVKVRTQTEDENLAIVIEGSTGSDSPPLESFASFPVTKYLVRKNKGSLNFSSPGEGRIKATLSFPISRELIA